MNKLWLVSRSTRYQLYLLQLELACVSPIVRAATPETVVDAAAVAMLFSFWFGTALSAFAHPKLGHHVPQTVQEADECAGWLNGSLGTYHDAHTRSWSPGGYTSQFRQDKILFNMLFRNRTNRGIYLDIASNHYKRISNSYFYDRCLGWQGICVGAG